MRSAMKLLVAVLVLLLPLCRAACVCTYTNTDFECPTIGPEGNKTVGCEMGVSRFCVDGVHQPPLQLVTLALSWRCRTSARG